jgi:hypothetical protein
MKSSQYRFIDLHISVLVKYAITILIAAFLLFLFFQFSLWLFLCGTLLFVIPIFYLESGSVSISDGYKTPNIVIKTGNKRITLSTPIQADVWWNYTFKSTITELNDGSPSSGAKANDINVMLEVSDKSGQKVTFVEKIVFGSRFPNEANYSLEAIDESTPYIKVQRVDKLIELLEDHLVENL